MEEESMLVLAMQGKKHDEAQSYRKTTDDGML